MQRILLSTVPAWIASWLLGLAILPASQARDHSPLPVGQRTCLFLDDRFIAEQAGLKRIWHQGKPHREPAIVAQHKWEKWPHAFGSVLYDPASKLYKMWYEDIPHPRGAIFYAESRDARTWTKPKLGIYEFAGSRDNNAVLSPAELPNVLIDPLEKDPQARFKMLAWCGGVPFDKGKINGTGLFASPDGIRWKAVGPVRLPRVAGKDESRTIRDTNEMFWDPLAKTYMGTFRTYPLHPELPGWIRDDKFAFVPKVGGHRRGIGVSTSRRLDGDWNLIDTVLQADARDDDKVKKLSKGPQPDWAELYIMPAFAYGNHYIGLVSLLYLVDGKVDTAEGGGDLQLTFSHDGKKWQRQPDRRTLVAPSGTGLVPCYAACNEPLDMGDEMWIFYTEATSAHPAPGHKAMIRAATWRKDGFASMSADDKGSLLTPPLLTDGKSLHVNFRPRDGGSLRVAVLDKEGKTLRATADCDAVTKDGVARRVTWRSNGDLGAQKREPVQLRFHITRGELYAFRFCE